MPESTTIPAPRWRRRMLILLAIVAVIAAAGVLAVHFASRTLKTRIEQALGPDSEVRDITLGWSSVQIHGLKVTAPRGWPAADTVRAGRIVVVPDWRLLLSANLRIHRIAIEDAYLSVLRARDGRLRLLPRMLEQKSESAGAPPVAIGEIVLTGGALEFFDETIRKPPHRIRIDELTAKLANVHVPDLAGRTQIALDGVIRGPHRNGRLSIAGWAEIATRDSELISTLRGVDVVAFEPYLLKTTETGVKRGSLDLDLKSRVKSNVLHAPGRLTLADLQLASAGTFMGVPRDAVLRAMKGSDGRITVDFALDGRLDDPKFSLNESLGRRLGAAAGEALGVSVEGIARGAGDAARGIGESVLKMLGK